LTLTGKAGEMAVSWVEMSATCSTMKVAYGTSAGSLPQGVTSAGYAWTRFNMCMHDAVMTGLAPNTRYYYAINGRNFSFVNAPARQGGKIYAIYADFGLANDVSLADLVNEAAAGSFDAVIHGGDIAYDLQSYSGATGNSFMNAVEPFAAAMPVMMCVGNHESDSRTFENYIVRFAALNGTATESGSTSSLWYSFNDELVHWVAVDTELWYYGPSTLDPAVMLEWLKDDLKRVDRGVTPWLVAYGHKQAWMDSSNFTATEALLQDAHTNLYFCGHQHNYQRLLPQRANVVSAACVSDHNTTYTDCTDMTTVVAGSPGCREKLSSGHAPRGVAAFAQAYGYGKLTVVNATHLHWGFTEVSVELADGTYAAATNAFTDEFWMIQLAQKR